MEMSKEITEAIYLTVNLPPVTKKNSPKIIDTGQRCPRCGRGSVSLPLPSKQFTRYQKDCGWFLGPAKGLSLNVPLNVEARYYISADVKSDLCNYHAALHDILTHYRVIEDDNRNIIVSTDGSRVYVDSENPRTEIIITPAAR
jgi:Holliday junction resolvase RusA-like endonuclease